MKDSPIVKSGSPVWISDLGRYLCTAFLFIWHNRKILRLAKKIAWKSSNFVNVESINMKDRKEWEILSSYILVLCISFIFKNSSIYLRTVICVPIKSQPDITMSPDLIYPTYLNFSRCKVVFTKIITITWHW